MRRSWHDGFEPVDSRPVCANCGCHTSTLYDLRHEWICCGCLRDQIDNMTTESIAILMGIESCEFTNPASKEVHIKSDDLCDRCSVGPGGDKCEKVIKNTPCGMFVPETRQEADKPIWHDGAPTEDGIYVISKYYEALDCYSYDLVQVKNGIARYYVAPALTGPTYPSVMQKLKPKYMKVR